MELNEFVNRAKLYKREHNGKVYYNIRVHIKDPVSAYKIGRMYGDHVIKVHPKPSITYYHWQISRKDDLLEFLEMVVRELGSLPEKFQTLYDLLTVDALD